MRIFLQKLSSPAKPFRPCQLVAFSNFPMKKLCVYRCEQRQWTFCLKDAMSTVLKSFNSANHKDQPTVTPHRGPKTLGANSWWVRWNDKKGLVLFQKPLVFCRGSTGEKICESGTFCLWRWTVCHPSDPKRHRLCSVWWTCTVRGPCPEADRVLQASTDAVGWVRPVHWPSAEAIVRAYLDVQVRE